MKATHEQLKRHNWQLVLRAIFRGEASSRAALAQLTDLAKPTVSDIVTELMAYGYVMESGPGVSTDIGGKRPTLLRFVPDARQIIGVSVERDHAVGVLTDLAGIVIAEHHIHAHDYPAPASPLDLIRDVTTGLMAQLDAPLLCIAIGIPGVVDTRAGVVRSSEALGWYDYPLARSLSLVYDCPIYVGSKTELVALAQFAFDGSLRPEVRHLVTVVVDQTIEIGIAIDGAAYHNGSDISSLRPYGDRSSARLDQLLHWDHVRQLAASAQADHPGSRLAAQPLDYLSIAYAAEMADPAANAVIAALAQPLALIIAWVIGLIAPDHIALAGPISDLGDPLLKLLHTRLDEILLPAVSQSVSLSLSTAGGAMAARGAVAYSLRQELGIV